MEKFKRVSLHYKQSMVLSSERTKNGRGLGIRVSSSVQLKYQAMPAHDSPLPTREGVCPVHQNKTLKGIEQHNEHPSKR